MSNNRNGVNNETVIDMVPSIDRDKPQENRLVPTFNPNTGRYEMAAPRLGYSINNAGIGRIIYSAESEATLPAAYLDGSLEVCAKPLYGKKAIVVGLGSFGARIAAELAATGISSFEVWDDDVIETQNLSRHIAGHSDVGKRKIDVVERIIKEKNPAAAVKTHFAKVESDPAMFKSAVCECDVLCACSDNNESRFFMDDIARSHGKTTVFSRAYARAEGGDVFISRPGKASYADYLKQIAGVNELVATEKQGRRRGDIPAYSSEEDVDVIVQPGLGIDILPILYLHSKLALMVAAHGTDSELFSFEEEIGDANFFLWGSVRREGNPFWDSFQPFNATGLKPTCFRWYPMCLERITSSRVRE